MTPTATDVVPHVRTVIATAVTMALVTLASGGAHAAFFQLAENSPAGLGNANAGGAAIADDASTIWYNPAGLTRLNGSQFVAGGHFIVPSLKFSKTSATALTTVPINGGDGGDAGESAIVPNFYFAHRHDDRLTFGIGVNAPFGLATDYEDGWVGRYHADRSEILTINVNPVVAYKINDAFSVGGGISYQKIEAELSQAVDFATICTVSAGGAFSGTCGAGAGFNPATNPNDGHARVNADDDAWGYNIGFLWQLSADTRVGMHYRSELDYGLSGSVSLTSPGNVPAPLQAAAGGGSGASADVTLPATLSLSAFTQLSPAWALMGDVTRTYWGDLSALKIDFTNTATPDDAVVTLNLKDVNRYSVGATHSPGDAWVYRFGIALDKSPTPNATDRTPRLPDEDRTWYSFGVGYKASDKMTFDIAYTYIKVDDAHVEKTATPTNENATRGNLVGDYEADTHILSAQVNWKF